MYLRVCITMIMAIALLTACGKEEPLSNETAGNEPMGEPVVEGQLEEPPKVMLVSGDQQLTAVQGTTSWQIDLGNGKFTGFEADSDDPMGLVKYQGVPLTVNNGDSITIETSVDDVVFQVWKYSEDGRGEAVIVKDNAFIVDMSEGSQVYEMIATFEQGIVYYGLEVTLAEQPAVLEEVGTLYSLGRASVRIEMNNGMVIYIDPYAGSSEDYAKPADLVLVTHQHEDHNDIDRVTLKEDGEVYQCPMDIRPDTSITVKGIDIYATNAANANHDKRTNCGFIMNLDGAMVYHSGDTSYIKEMKTYKDYHIDYALICSDDYYNMGPKEASKVARVIEARVMIPIHTSADGEYNGDNAKACEHDELVILEPGDGIAIGKVIEE